MKFICLYKLYAGLFVGSTSNNIFLMFGYVLSFLIIICNNNLPYFFLLYFFTIKKSVRVTVILSNENPKLPDPIKVKSLVNNKTVNRAFNPYDVATSCNIL